MVLFLNYRLALIEILFCRHQITIEISDNMVGLQSIGFVLVGIFGMSFRNPIVLVF